MSMPVWVVELIKKGFAGRFTLARLTRVPVVGRAIDHVLFEGDDLLVLPKGKVIPVEKPVKARGETVLPSRVVEHFIEEARYHWVMDKCICRDASRCKRHPIDLGCLFLGEAVLGINPRLGRLVTRAEAHEHARRCREAGLVHLVGRNKLDTVWLNVGPGERLLTICNCCSCCCLWRMLPDLSAGIGDKVRRMPGVEVMVTDRCEGCGTCTRDVCFAGAIRLVEERAVIDGACRGCGRCVEVCPRGAIEISFGRDRSVRESIERLSPLVDVS